MKKYLVKVDEEEFIVQIRLLEDDQKTQPATATTEVTKVETPKKSVATPGEKIEAPLGGTILKINFKPGDRVKSGDVLLTLEALKLENEIVAPFDGKVIEVLTSVGASVEAGEALIVLEKE